MKYQAPITAEQVILSTPLATAQLHSHTNMVPAIAHPAHSLTCHSQAVLLGKGFRAYPIKVSRKIKVKKGIDAMRDTRRVKGESASRNGLSINVFVANVRIAEVVRISCGRVRRRREVINPRTRGMIANSLNLEKVCELGRKDKDVPRYVPYRFSPCRIGTLFPHEATYERP